MLKIKKLRRFWLNKNIASGAKTDHRDRETTAAVRERVVQEIFRLNERTHSLMLKYAMVMGILTTPPAFPGVAEAQLAALVILNGVLAWRIGAEWGFPKGQTALARLMLVLGILGAIFLYVTAWVVGYSISLFVPPFRCAGRVAAAFVTTLAFGRTVNDYYLSGRRTSRRGSTQAPRTQPTVGDIPSPQTEGVKR